MEENLDTYITMAECVYRSTMKTDNPSLLNFFWDKESISEQDIVSGISDGTVFGLVKCSIMTPDAAKQKELLKYIFVRLLKITDK